MQKFDLELYRGEKKSLTLEVDGDITIDKVFFTSKANRDITGDRLIEKGNTLTESTGLTTTLVPLEDDKSKTVIEVFFNKTDTYDITEDFLEYDIIRQNATDDTDITPIATGTIRITPNVRSDFDGYNLPSDIGVTRLLTLDADNLDENSFIITEGEGESASFVIKTLNEIKELLTINFMTTILNNTALQSNGLASLLLNGSYDDNTNALNIDMQNMFFTIDLNGV